MVSDFNAFATENKGVFRIGSVDCEAQSDICKKEGIQDYPTFRVYPPFPAPNIDLTSTKFEGKELKKKAGKFI